MLLQNFAIFFKFRIFRVFACRYKFVELFIYRIHKILSKRENLKISIHLKAYSYIDKKVTITMMI